MRGLKIDIQDEFLLKDINKMTLQDIIIKAIRVDSRFYQRKNQNQTDKKPKQAKSNQGKKRHKP